MIFIAHRGNTAGPLTEYENNPQYLQEALNNGFNIETDVWLKDGTWFLGHDSPQYPLADTALLLNPYTWCHAKNIEALAALNTMGAHCFWHNIDDYTLTSHCFIWTYPGKIATPQSIIVMNKHTDFKHFKDAAGICCDNIEFFRDTLGSLNFLN